MRHGAWTPLEKTHWAPFRNDSGETIPPFSVLRVTGTVTVHGRTYFMIGKPTGTQEKWYPVNGTAAVSNGKFGECTFTPQSIVAWSGSTPGAGEEAGPSDDTWTLSTAGTGFYTLGVRETTRTLDLVEVIQTTAPTSTSTTVADFAFAHEPSQSVTKNSLEETLTWGVTGTSGDYGDVTRDTATHRFEVEKAGVWQHFIRFDAKFASGGTGSWTTVSSCDVKSFTTGASVQIGQISLDGMTGDAPLRCVAVFSGWALSIGNEVWGAVDTGVEDVQIVNMEQELIYLGTAS